MGFELDDIEEQQKVAETAAAEVLQSVEEEHTDKVRQEQEVMETLSEAVKRIEEANLWKTLLTMDVFTVESARNEIVSSANAKLRKFARENLEICVGIKSVEQERLAVQQVKLPFDTEEMQALKILAAKVLKRDVSTAILSEYKPAVAQVNSSPTGTQVRTVKAASLTPTPVQKQAIKKPAAKKVNKQTVGAGYIPPVKNYVPPTQSAATVSANINGALPTPVNMSNLVANLIQTATGGNILAQDNSAPSSDGNDVNERF